MSALEGEGVGYVEGGTPGCNGVCGDCVIPAYTTDPNNSYYQYAEFTDCRLNCWPYHWAATIDLPVQDPMVTETTASVDIGLSKRVPALNAPFVNVSEVMLSSQRSQGLGDIPAGQHYCYINRINEAPLPLDQVAYAVPGTVNVSGPYTVLVEGVSYLDGSSHRMSYRFNTVEMVTSSDPFDAGPIGGFRSVFYGLDFGFPASGSISGISVFGCPAFAMADDAITLDIAEPQQQDAGAYVP